jgi:hypothetical protein
MMGPTKLSAIREQVRQSFRMTDAELATWLDHQANQRRSVAANAEGELESLRLFRDALLREVKMARPRRKGRRAPTGRS